MRVLMLAQFYPPIIGGEERMVHDLSVALAARGHNVTVATLHHRGLPEDEVDQGVRIHRLRSTAGRAGSQLADGARRHAPPAPDPEAMWGLRRLMHEHQPEIVHAHNWLVYSYLPLKRFFPARLVVTLHDYSLRCVKKRLMYRGAQCSGPRLDKCPGCAVAHYGPAIGLPTAAAHALMSGPAHWAVDMFLPISQAVADGSGLPGSRWPYQVIPDFVLDEPAEREVDVSEYTRQLPPDGFLMFAGDLSSDKGVAVLLEAYAGLEGAPPLVLIGRQPAGQPAPRGSNVVVFNHWPHAAVLAAWQHCSVALVPSVWAEPFGLVVLEAMAAARPVIASRTGGISDILVDRESGWLVAPGDAAALRAAIAQLLAAPELRLRLGQAAGERTAIFRASVVVPRVEQVYRGLLAAGRQPAALRPAPDDRHEAGPAADV